MVRISVLLLSAGAGVAYFFVRTTFLRCFCFYVTSKVVQILSLSFPNMQPFMFVLFSAIKFVKFCPWFYF